MTDGEKTEPAPTAPVRPPVEHVFRRVQESKQPNVSDASKK